MMSGVPLKTRWAFNKVWNNKFYYKLHLVGISTESYYDARIHEYQHSPTTLESIVQSMQHHIKEGLNIQEHRYEIIAGWVRE